MCEGVIKIKVLRYHLYRGPCSIWNGTARLRNLEVRDKMACKDIHTRIDSYIHVWLICDTYI